MKLLVGLLIASAAHADCFVAEPFGDAGGLFTVILDIAFAKSPSGCRRQDVPRRLHCDAGGGARYAVEISEDDPPHFQVVRLDEPQSLPVFVKGQQRWLCRAACDSHLVH